MNLRTKVLNDYKMKLQTMSEGELFSERDWQSATVDLYKDIKDKQSSILAKYNIAKAKLQLVREEIIKRLEVEMNVDF